MPHVAVITDVLEAMDEKHGALSEHEIILLIGGTLFFFFFWGKWGENRRPRSSIRIWLRNTKRSRTDEWWHRDILKDQQKVHPCPS